MKPKLQVRILGVALGLAIILANILWRGTLATFNPLVVELSESLPGVILIAATITVRATLLILAIKKYRQKEPFALYPILAGSILALYLAFMNGFSLIATIFIPFETNIAAMGIVMHFLLYGRRGLPPVD